jgi:hypothetical protein
MYVELDFLRYVRGLESRNDQENIVGEGEVDSGVDGERRPTRHAASGNAREIMEATPPGEHRRGR